MSVIYDAGALLAADRGDHRMRAVHASALAVGSLPVIPAPVVWQAWRDGSRQARLSKLLRGCVVKPTDEQTARSAGELLGRAGTSDGVDALVIVTAAQRGGVIYTSDPRDLKKLAQHISAPKTFTIISV